MKQLFSRFPQGALIVVLAIVFAVHASILSQMAWSLSAYLTWQAYLFNAIAAVAILTILLRLANKSKDYLGFVFMGGSLLKFLVFFLFFYPVYKEDGQISSLEFTSFFVPYLICLAFKSFLLLKRLNKN